RHWNLGRRRHRRHSQRSRYPVAEVRLVPEVVCPPPSPPGGHRRTRPLDENWPGESGRLQAEQNAPKLQRRPASFNKYGSYLLSQAFSEGCPTHPSYPTGHGTVGGACVTVLKFFFNGSWTIPNPVMPSDDGLSLQPYPGPSLTVNGELAKIAHNVSFGHGIHAGIHCRSDTDQSLLFGEAVALRVLQDRASCYNEKFSVSITKFDGTTATISN